VLEDDNAIADAEELLAASLNEEDFEAVLPLLAAKITVPCGATSITMRIALPPRYMHTHTHTTG